jgi:hypothetical protein
MPRPCSICSNAAKAAKALELINLGLSDAAVAAALSAMTPGAPAMSPMAANRHRHKHILQVARDQIAVVSKGSAERVAREKIAAAATSGAPTPAEFVEAFFGLKAQADKLTVIESRLERMGVVAEAGQSPTAVATLAGQALKAIEVGGKLAALPGFVPARTTEQAAGMAFSVVIQFSGGETVSITPSQVAAPPTTIDAEPDDAKDDTPADQDPPQPSISRLARAFGGG